MPSGQGCHGKGDGDETGGQGKAEERAVAQGKAGTAGFPSRLGVALEIGKVCLNGAGVGVEHRLKSFWFGVLMG